MPDNYQHKLVCPKDGKHTVYLKEVNNEFWYYCKSCGYEWKA